MKKIFATLLTFGLIGPLMAQELPRASAKGSVTQHVGLTRVSVEYYRPNMKERTIWGDLVPYDKLWRTGANAATKISFDTPITFGGANVDSGSYAMFTIPGKDKWKVILNSEADQWGAYEYDSTKNVAEVSVNPRDYCESLESFTIGFRDAVGGSTILSIKWDQIEVPVEISVDLKAQVKQSLQAALQDTSVEDYEAYSNVAVYFMRIGDHATAEEMANKSKELNADHWYSTYILASLAGEKEDYSRAINMMEKAIALGEKEAKEKGEEFRWKKPLQKMIDEWKEEK